jgi:hypothetical protein
VYWYSNICSGLPRKLISLRYAHLLRHGGLIRREILIMSEHPIYDVWPRPCKIRTTLICLLKLSNSLHDLQELIYVEVSCDKHIHVGLS